MFIATSVTWVALRFARRCCALARGSDCLNPLGLAGMAYRRTYKALARWLLRGGPAVRCRCRIRCAALLAALWISICAPYLLAAEPPAQGSLLRLVAGTTGTAPDPENPQPESPPPPAPGPGLVSDSLDTVPPGVAVPAGDPVPPGEHGYHWTNPYEATLTDVYTGPDPRPPCKRWLPPPGILPFWGPRSSEAERFTGWGQPLYGTSWLNRPFGAGWFAGFIQGGAPIHGTVGQHGGFFGGYRFTWDYDYYYGLEARLGGAAIGLEYPEYNRPTATSDYYVADVSVLYYPWGDSRWRPFVTLGVGTTKINFFDYHDNYYSGVLVSLPYGIGCKYRLREWVTFRGEIMDNVAFGRGPFSTFQNVSYTAGFEIRFGGLRKLYYPYNPSSQMW